MSSVRSVAVALRPEYWPTISVLLLELGGEPLYLNGETDAATVDGLVHHDYDD